MDARQSQLPQRKRQISKGQRIILLIFTLFIIVLGIVVLVILTTQGVTRGSGTLNIIFLIFGPFIALLALMFAILQWRYPIAPDTPDTQITSPPTIQNIIHLPSTPLAPFVPLQPSSPQSSYPIYRGIVGEPPLSDSRSIQQRERTVKDVYSKLIQPNVTAVALVGMGGAGKSTLAALIYQHTEEQRHTGAGPFTASPLWLRIDPSVTLVDILGNLCNTLDAPLPDVSALSPQNQATVLFHLLNNVDKPRLIVLDQFENILAQDGQALPDRPGIGEWIDALNSRPCTCRILLTSRRIPQGTYDSPSTFFQTYQVEVLSEAESIELLRKRNVSATDAELRIAVKRYDGHALSLSLLASLLQKRNLSLGTLLNSPHYSQLWAGQIALKLLDAIYKEQLDAMQRLLLAAFSVYREPVPLDAAQAIFDDPTGRETSQAETALDGLLTQYFLGATGEGRYQPHAIVAEYARDHMVEDKVHDQQANRQMLLMAHDKAAQYYLRRAVTTCPQKDHRQRVGDVHDLIEAVWHYCQAEMWPEAYRVMDEEEIFDDLKGWGGNATLQELYKLLLPLDKWRTPPDNHQIVYIYNNLGRVYSDSENKGRALEYYNRALEISVKLGNSEELTRTLNNLGWIYSELENKEQALGYFEQALKISREIGDDKREASTLNGFGWLYNGQGNKELAREYYHQALEIYRKRKERKTLKGEGWTLNNLGKVYTALENWEQAANLLNEALIIRRDELNNRWEAGRTLRNLGETYIASGRTQEALEPTLEALRIAKDVGDLRGEGRALDVLGQVRQALGEKELALDCFQRALHLHREMKDRRHQAKTLGDLATYLANLPAQQDQAKKDYISALSIYMELGDRWGEALMLEGIGTLCFRQGRYSAALACFLCAQNIFEEIQSHKYAVAQKQIDDLRKKVGEDEFEVMLAQIEPQTSQIIEQIMSEGLVRDR